MIATRFDAEKGVVISVEASAQIGEAGAIAREFRDLLATAPSLVTLSLEGISAVDISFFQLLLSLKSALESRGLRLELETLPADHVVSRASRLLGIDLDGLRSGGPR